MSIKYQGRAVVLTAESKPYKFTPKGGDEIQGTSHRVRLNVSGEIYNIKSSEDLVKQAQAFLGKEAEVELLVSSPKEELKIEIVSIG